MTIASDPDWLRCRPLIEAALAQSPGLENIEDVEQLIDEGVYQFWPATRSAVVTEIANFKRRKALSVVHGGGDLAELLDVIEPILCDYATLRGCDAIMGLGRRGWDRECQKRGYDFAYVTMIKDLSPE